MSETILLVPHMSSWNGHERIYLSFILKLDVQLQANVAFYRRCTFLESTLQIRSKYGGGGDDGDDDDDDEQ